MQNAEVWILLDSSAPGGIETHVRGLAAQLLQLGWRAVVMFYQNHGAHPLRSQLDQDGVPWRNLDGTFSGLLSALRQQRPPLLHTHGYKAGIVGRVAARFANIPCVHTYHAGEPGVGRVRLWHGLDRCSGVLCDARIAVSNAIARQLPWPTDQIGNFVAIPRQPSAGVRSREIAFVGRLSQEKGPDLFCEVARRFAGRAQFHVYGDGPMGVSLKQQYGEVVQFHGFTADMGGVWARSGLLLVTSRYEGLPLVALEAMAHGVPVAAARAGALPELLDDGVSGWLFDVADIDGAAAALRKWLAADSGMLQGVCRQARATVQNHYSRAALVARIDGVYRRVLAARGCGPAATVDATRAWRQ
jgi:glycosyltransferase involved in cell wall biosynthesis